MSDETELRKIIGAYRKRQHESFAYLETTAEEWRACEITGMNQVTSEITDFDIDSGYATVTPISDRLTPEQMAQLQDMLQNTEWAKRLCELCGHVIKDPYPIAHDKKKLVMYVGSECVNNFTPAGKEYKEKKSQFKDNLIKQKFKVWAPIAINEIWAKGKEDPSTNYLKPEYFRLLKAIRKAREDPDETSARKMRNMFKRAIELGINAPAEPIPAKKKK